MPVVCTHEFFWPLRAADGRYYQVCRICGVKCEYDWMTMERVGGVPGVTLAPGVSGPSASARPEIQPQLRLLVELEPAHRVFLRNLVDMLRSSVSRRAHDFGRRLSGAKPFSTPASPGSGLRNHWWASWLCLPWCCSAPRCGLRKINHGGAACLKIPISPTTSQTARFRRYAATRRGYAGCPRKPVESARRGSIRVAPERAQADVKAPDIKLKGPGDPIL